MSIMLILMALAVPQMLKLKKHANETSHPDHAHHRSGEMEYDSSYHTYACPISLLGAIPNPARRPPRPRSCSIPPWRPARRNPIHLHHHLRQQVTINNQDVYDSYDLIGVPQSVAIPAITATAPTRTISSKSTPPGHQLHP